MRAYERLLNYVRVYTTSDPESGTHPSAEREFDLARQLVEEMKALGIEDARVDEHCYVYATLPATPGHEAAKGLGFIAHMDTVSDYCNGDINPVVTPDYDGGDLVLGNSGLILSPDTFPHLASLKGRTLITSDGTTILGADDKAGIAEILTMIEYITANNIEHPAICVAFTPDEEIGMGTEHFDVERFGADYAYTVDGDTEGEIQYENFNAAKAEYVVKGFNVHPGSSKDTMINASLVAMEINNCLPAMEIPRETENYEGFYHLISMSGDVAEAHLNYIIRDHDASLFEAKKATLCHIEKIMNEKWGAGTVQLTITDQYRNMAEIIKKCMLSYMGLPCPNLGTGGHAYHGPYEHITIEGMDKTVDMLVELVKTFSKPIIN